MRVGSAQELWETALGELQLVVSKPNYKTWLEKTKGLTFRNNEFTIGVPNTFAAEYLENNQRSLIEKTLSGLSGSDVRVMFEIDKVNQMLTGNNGERQKDHNNKQATSDTFNAKYTFDSFIVGNSNRLAYSAALGVAKQPGHKYNPLFIYGEVGLGKTHLLHAIGHAALANNFRVLYVNAEQFTYEFINAIFDKKTEDFRNKYRNVDMLLIDDIQFISGKEQTEESFFHTFNDLHNANRQIIITSDNPPKSIPLIEEKLRSRLEWGLIADIQQPSLETRIDILQAKAKSEGSNIDAVTLEFIASRIQHNIRKLEGSLNRVVAYAQLLGVPPTPETASKALEDIASKAPRAGTITPALVVEAVSQSFDLTPNDIRSKKRDKETALARQVAMYLIKREINCSLNQIGKELGGRDHSTVIHSIQKIAKEITDSSYLNDKIAEIQHKLHSQSSAENN